MHVDAIETDYFIFEVDTTQTNYGGTDVDEFYIPVVVPADPSLTYNKE